MKLFKILFFASIGILASYAVFAADKTDIAYPVVSLGNCQSEQECETYCDDPANIKVCVEFAKNQGMISPQEAQVALQFADGLKGPGGCQSKGECEAYCDDTNNLPECLAFAEQHNLMNSQEIADAKKVAQALSQGASLPGNCRNKSQCDNYCSDPVNIEECLDFAQKAGLISQEELTEARRVAPFIKRGEMPGNCRTKEQCESYCDDFSHAEECAVFFEKAGFITSKEAEMFRKTGGRGPGGCKGKEVCDAFCQDPKNEEMCFNFGMERGLISEENLREMEESKIKMKESLAGASGEVLTCLEGKIGTGMVGKIKSGDFMPNRKIGEGMKECFEDYEKLRQAQEIQRFQEMQRFQENQRLQEQFQEQPNQEFDSPQIENQNLPNIPQSSEPESQNPALQIGASILDAAQNFIKNFQNR